MSERTVVPNVYGVETEYSAMLTFPGSQVYEIVGKCHSEDERLGLYVEPKSKGTAHIEAAGIKAAIEAQGIYATADGMLSNGGRFYIDPSGPEYDTPETLSAEEAVHRTFDGDDVVLKMMSSLRETGILQDFQLNRRIVDHNRSSRGVHLNTCTSLPASVMPSKRIINALSTLNVVKGSMFGSGGLLVDKDGATAFHHSPRLSITTHLCAKYSFYRYRPLVRHPFKEDGEDLARVETVTSDALNFGWPLRASLVVTNAVIRALELERGVRFPALRRPIRAAHMVGRDGYKAIVGVTRWDDDVHGERAPAVLRSICELLLTTDSKEDFLDAEARQVLPEIIDVADRISKDPQSVSGQVESITREIAMKRKMDQKGVVLDSETMCRFDYAWDWLGGGIAESLRNRNRVGWQGFRTNHSPSASARRRLTPPKSTRASVRGEMIKQSKGTVTVSWQEYASGYLHPLDTEIPANL